MLGESNDVEPRFLINEVELISLWLWPSSLDILSSSCLQERSNIISCEFLSSDQDLEADHQHKGNLVLLEKAAVDVTMDVFGHHLDDEVHSLLRRVGFGGFLREGPVEQLQELLERTVVHPVDQEKLD